MPIAPSAPNPPSPASKLTTPIIIKDDPDIGWPEHESVFYMMSRDGLYICRNHEFFRSCAPARDWPKGLERQSAFLVPRYPKLSQRQIELVVGFFGVVGEAHGAEAAVLLAWNRVAGRVELVVPDQVAHVDRSWSGRCYPLSLDYSCPTDLPPTTYVFGDVHSHVDLPAYSSGTDVEDEEYQAGLHIVVGRIHREPPDVHVEAVVDGQRFMLDPHRVIDDYQRRAVDVPEEWIERVQIAERSWSGSWNGAGGTWDGTWNTPGSSASTASSASSMQPALPATTTSATGAHAPAGVQMAAPARASTAEPATAASNAGPSAEPNARRAELAVIGDGDGGGVGKGDGTDEGRGHRAHHCTRDHHGGSGGSGVAPPPAIGASGGDRGASPRPPKQPRTPKAPQVRYSETLGRSRSGGGDRQEGGS